METDVVIHNLDFESAKKPVPGQSLLQRNWKDAITDEAPISVKNEDIANLNDDFPNRPIDMISQPRIHTDTSDFCSTNGNSSSLNDNQSMDINEKDSGLPTVNSKSPIIKEELIEVDEYTDDTKNHSSSNVALQLKMEWERTSDSQSEIHSPKTNQSERSSCGNDNHSTTVTTISTICKEELDLDVQSIMVKEESHNVDEIDMKLEASMRGNITKYSKSQNDSKNCDSTSSDNEKQQYMCHSCPQKFPTRRGFINHLISHHAKFVVYKCRACELSFISKAAFSEHSADCHSKFQVNESNRPLVTTQFVSNSVVKVNGTKTQGQLLTLVYRCSICTKEFKAEISLRNHLEGSLSCKKCLKLFCSSTELQIHNKVHDNDILFLCSTCKRRFKYKRMFRIHTNSKKVTCEICSQSFCVNLDLLKHQQTCKHCTICKKKFDNERKLESHIKNKQVSCNVCGEKFCENIHLREHKEEFWHWPMPADLFPCKLCSEKFSTPTQMKNHMAQHSVSLDLNHNQTGHKDELPDETLGSKGEESLSCNQCLKVFCSSTELQIHNKVHDADILLECSTCNRKIKYEIIFRSHNSRKKVTCRKCAESFCHIFDLEMHQQNCKETYEFPIKYSHEKSIGLKKAESRSEGHSISKFICTICGKKFDNERKLESHIDIEQVTCNVCGEKFCENIKLREHKEKFWHWPMPADLFPCKLCSEKFSTPTQMRIHMTQHSVLLDLNHNKTDHKDERPDDALGSKEVNTISCPTKINLREPKEKFWLCPMPADLLSCKLCSKKFSTSRQMRIHMAEHSISCRQCPQKFLSSLDLLNHNKTDHKDELPEETLDSRGVNAISPETISCPTKMNLRSFCQDSDLQIHKQTCMHSHKKSFGIKKAVGPSDSHNLRKFYCTTCRCKFDCEKKLKIHISKKQKTCNVCGEEFCKNNLFDHEAKFGHSPWPRPSVQVSCKLCSEKFDSPKQLMDHVAEHYSYIISCGLCPRKFLTTLDLLNHNETDHKDELPEET